MTHIVPLDSLARRIPIVAKLRSGATTSTGRPRAIDKWRATTSSRPWAENFAARYGGEVKPFGNDRSPHSWEVFSETTEIAIALIEDGYTINYEQWSGGGCQRRCNGITAQVLQTTGPDNVEYVDAPCLCERKGVLECSLKSRLTFVMPDLPFAGGCVYETSSKNFAEESQGMLQLIQQMQARGITRGVLRLEQRKSSGNRKYTIAVVGVTSSLEEIAGTNSQALAPAEDRPALTTSPVGEGEAPADEPSTEAEGGGGGTDSGRGAAVAAPLGQEVEDDVIDAELVEPCDICGSTGDDHGNEAHEAYERASAAVEDEEPEPPRDNAKRAKLRATFMAVVQGEMCKLKYDREVRPFLEANYGGSWSELPDEQQQRLVDKLTSGSRSEKEAAQKRFGEIVKQWHGAEVKA